MVVEAAPSLQQSDARSRSPVGNRKRARVDAAGREIPGEDPEAVLHQARQAAAACQQVLASGPAIGQTTPGATAVASSASANAASSALAAPSSG
jgi:hypothetical protein